MDWQGIFVPTLPVLETVFRGSVVYLLLLFLMRLGPKRESGSLGTADVLFVVLVADAAQNAMAAEYKSVTDGAILVATLLFWNYAIDWVAYHFPPVRRFLSPPPLLLVKDGKMNRRNMRRELVSEEDLMAQLRLQGVAKMDDVLEAWIEADGGISVIPKPEGEG